MKLAVPDYILSIKPYAPGKPLDELEREYGISDSIKLASNENPLGPSPRAVEAMRHAIPELHRYPDGSGHELIEKISRKLRVSPTNIVLGNGSDEVIGMLTRALLRPGDEAIIPQPSFLMYEIMVRSCGAQPVFVPLESLCIDLDGIKDKITPQTRMVFICNPNTPTGTILSENRLGRFLKNIPVDVLIVVDEAYFEFVRDQDFASSINYLDSGRAVVTLRTFSKAYGLAGLRIGYGVMPEAVSGVLNRIRQPFNANTLAQVAARAALEDEAFLAETKRVVHEGLDFLYNSLDELGIKYFTTQSNFFLIDIKKDADDVFKRLLREGVIVRPMISYGYPEFIRINVGLYEENVRFIKAIKKVLL